ncbi:MAG TPA: GAF domain-containing protein, partial [Gemmatimonadaceae bacterium]|nr:GAF domain-containing protein [Gemmatimonadaceae bacterium]
MNAPFPSRSSTVASGASAPPDAARALAEIVQRVAGSRDVDEVVDLITRRAAALLGGRASCLGLLDGDEIVVAARYGTELPRGPREPVAGSFAGEAILARAPVRTRDILADGTRWPWSARHAPGLAVNGIGAPLLIGDRAIGVITVFGREAGDFSADDESLLMALGHHAAVAIENARLLRSAERSVRHARLLATAARSLALNVTPRSMYADIGRLARSALGASGLAIYLADPAADSVELPYTEGVGADAAHLIVPRFWSALGGAAVRSGVAEFRREIRATSGEPEPVLKLLLDLGIESLALLPLLVEGRPRGLLVLRFTSRQA